MTEYIVRVYENGTIEWYLNGKLHREDGPSIEYPDGTKQWWFNGERHREDGPAVEYPDGTKHWFFNGKLHREDGPACEQANGTKFWFFNGDSLTEEEFNQRVNVKEMSIDQIQKMLGYKINIVE